MGSDLVERLTTEANARDAWAVSHPEDNDEGLTADMREAAARIAELEAALSAATAERDAAIAMARLKDELAEAAEAEAARLREALGKMTAHYVMLASSGDCGFWNVEAEPEVIAARAALGGDHG